MSQELSILTKDWILDHFANEDLWIANFTKNPTPSRNPLYLRTIHKTKINQTRPKS